MFSTLRYDFLHAFRALLARPGYALAAILTLALGLGATTAVFSALNGYLLRPLPYPDGERLFSVYGRVPSFGDFELGLSLGDYFDVRERVGSIEAIGLYKVDASSIAELHGEPRAARISNVTPSLLPMLGARPAHGRLLVDEDAAPGAPPVVVLTHREWVERFGADPRAVGRKVRVGKDDVEIVGVLDAGLVFPDPRVDALRSFVLDPAKRGESRGDWRGNTIVRVQPGTTPATLEANLRELWKGFAAENPQMKFFVDDMGYLIHVKTLRESASRGLGRTLVLVQLAALLVLLVAGANLAGLALTRVADRLRELAVRSALGAGVARLLRHIAIENLVIALAGGALGLALALAALEIIEARGLGPAASLLTFAPDATVFAAGFALALACGVGASLAPVVWLRRRSLEAVLRGDARIAGGGKGAQRMRATLVVGQLAVSTTLAVLVGLLGLSLGRLLAVDPGFVAEGVLAADFAARTPGEERVPIDVATVLGAVRAVPGVVDAGVTSCMPFGNCASMSTFRIAGRAKAEDEPDATAHHAEVDARYLDTLEIPIVQGRGLTGEAGTREAVVDAAMAKRHFPDGDALGATLELGEPGDASRNYTIVGIARPVHTQTLATAPTEPAFYVRAEKLESSAQLVVRLPQVDGAAALVTAAVERAAPGTTLRRPEWMTARVRESAGDRMPLLLLIGGFAALALVLAAIGIYALLALTVVRRHAELGVRAALGADRRSLMRLVLGQGGRLIALGLALGLVAAFAASGLVAAQMFGVTRAEPAIYAAALAVLGLVALAACWIPARRAAGISPAVALRHD